MYRPSKIIIHLENLRHNFQTLRGFSRDTTFFCPMVKANAYGHGLVSVARVLVEEGADTLGVALIEEGIQLRQAGFHNEHILVFMPYLDQKSVQAIIEFKITPVVSSFSELQLLAQQKTSIPIHIKFNTGMNRLGFAMPKADDVIAFIDDHSSLDLKGVCTHFLNGEDAFSSQSRTREQLQLFNEVKQLNWKKNIHWHVHNSASLLAHHCHQLQKTDGLGVRPGLSLYGIKPDIECQGASAKSNWEKVILKPVMEVKSKIIHLQKIRKGETVSYGGLYKATSDEVIGVLPIGYADGYMRNFSSKSEVLCRGQRIPVTGIVCMDYTMIRIPFDVVSESEFFNEEIVLLGEQQGERIGAEELGRIANTNAYEVVTQMSSRMPRIYK